MIQCDQAPSEPVKVEHYKNDIKIRDQMLKLLSIGVDFCFFQLSFFTNNQNAFKTYWSGHRGLLQLEKKFILVQMTNDKGGHYAGPFLASTPLSCEELHGPETKV